MQAELTHISALNIVWAVFIVWFVVDSIVKENFMELAVAAFLCILASGRLLYWIVSWRRVFKGNCVCLVLYLEHHSHGLLASIHIKICIFLILIYNLAVHSVVAPEGTGSSAGATRPS